MWLCKLDSRKHALLLEEKFTARNFHSLTSHANIDDLITLLVGAHENAAGALHLNALLYEHTFVGLRDSVLDHPCGGAA